MSTLNEARRYLDLRVGGWTDPTVDPHEMIEEVLGDYDTAISDALDGSITSEDHDTEIEALKEQHAKELDAGSARALNRASVAELLQALEHAISRERLAAIEATETRLLKQRAAEIEQQRVHQAEERAERQAKRAQRKAKRTGGPVLVQEGNES